jgi:hypothetical protein
MVAVLDIVTCFEVTRRGQVSRATPRIQDSLEVRSYTSAKTIGNLFAVHARPDRGTQSSTEQEQFKGLGTVQRQAQVEFRSLL